MATIYTLYNICSIYELQKVGKIKKNAIFSKKSARKFWWIKKLPYICIVKRKQPDDKTEWWIHLRARIRASHARHRGSNPLSTTKKPLITQRFFLFYTFAIVRYISSYPATIRSTVSPSRKIARERSLNLR